MKVIRCYAIFILLFSLASCTKSDTDGAAKVELTNCPVNSECTYRYEDLVDFDSQLKVKPGNFRSFYYTSVNHKLCEAQTKLYFKTSLDYKDFSITKNDIVNGAVGFKMICACCNTVEMLPIDGYIKGIKKDNQRWLIDAHVVLGTSKGTPIDTLDIRQYFTPLHLPD